MISSSPTPPASAGHTFIDVDVDVALMERTAANDDVAPVETAQDDPATTES